MFLSRAHLWAVVAGLRTSSGGRPPAFCHPRCLDGLLGLQGPLIYPYVEPDKELEGRSARPGTWSYKYRNCEHSSISSSIFLLEGATFRSRDSLSSFV